VDGRQRLPGPPFAAFSSGSSGGLAMKTALCMALSLVAVGAFVVGVRADPEEKTLKGTITCAKCDLHEADKCHTVIKVNEDGKDVVYYFDDDGSKKNHKQICTEAKKGKVTGVVEEKDGKKWIKVSKVEFEE
jgi:Family of unknown function (DUF6370)